MMLKIEYIWRELLYQTIEKKNPYFKISDLSDKFKMSTSVVSHGLYPLRELGIIKVAKKRSQVADVERLLFFWATKRNLSKDIIYTSHSKLPVFEREASLPGEVLPTAYSACRLYFNEISADYDNIYFYSKKVSDVKKRFPEMSKKNPNLFILLQDPFLSIYKRTPIAQVFVDLWNLPEWYAKEFYEAILLKIKGMIGI